jgi:UDP-N-acetylmuramoyl-L-alanyl-D-glutamate--2,6-diaminopimelate ligase
VAIQGTTTDGHAFIQTVVGQGAAAIICERMPANQAEHITYVQVKDTAEALAYMAANFYNNPSEKLKLVGVTGTNGKTTTATLLYRLLMQMGYRAGLLSTIENRIVDQVIAATHTTPDALTINKMLADMVQQGCTHAFMEVSSHALVQQRTAGLQFTGAIFTNITHDHLDYHKTFDEYIKAKKLLFDGLSKKAFALVNKDDRNGLVMVQNCKAAIHTFGVRSMADFKAKILANTLHGLELDIDGRQAWFRLMGEFNAYNLLGIYGATVLLGENADEVLTQLSGIEAAPGRFDCMVSPRQVTAIVDYAHTPDALQNVLETIHQFRNGNERLICVVGCGGNRDATKRPVMAELAAKMSDTVILTSDNPRFEDPEAIIEDMKKGISPSYQQKTLCITDRREAIRRACEIAQPNDVILIAGKGHENYQEIKGVKYHFDDKEEVAQWFKSST